MATGERVEAQNVTLYPSDWQKVRKYGDSLGVSVSAALRAIVRDWSRSRAITRPEYDALVDSGISYEASND